MKLSTAAMAKKRVNSQVRTIASINAYLLSGKGPGGAGIVRGRRIKSILHVGATTYNMRPFMGEAEISRSPT
jgi:hypothetical protein